MFLSFFDRDPALEISILDIFGFEEFQRNGYEQVRGDSTDIMRTMIITLLTSDCVAFRATNCSSPSQCGLWAS